MEQFIQLLVLALLSYPASIAIDAAVVFRLTKDLANEGYIFDLESLKEFRGESISSKLQKYPFINMLDAMRLTMIFNTYKDQFFLFLNTTGSLRKMSKEEEKTYNANPTAITALTLSSANEYKEKIESILKEKNLKTDIKVSIDKKNDINIEINSCNNDAKVEERIEEIIENDSKENEFVINRFDLEIQDNNINDIETKEKVKTRSLINKHKRR